MIGCRADVRRAFACIGTACALSAVLFIMSGGSIDARRVRGLISEALVLSIICMGSVFIFSSGAFGISLGASTLMGVAIGGAVYAGSDSMLAAFFACVSATVIGSISSSLLSCLFKLPKYVSAAVMLAIFGSAARAVIEMHGGAIYTGLGGGRYADSLYMRILFFVLYLLLCIIVFYILPTGKGLRLLGQDPELARLSGISRLRISLAGAAVAGLGVGLGAFLILCSYPSIDRGVTGDLGFNIIFAVLLGGMSLSGGERSRLYSAIFGAISAVLAGEVLRRAGEDIGYFSGVSQVIRACVLLLLFVAVGTAERSEGVENEAR